MNDCCTIVRELNRPIGHILVVAYPEKDGFRSYGVLLNNGITLKLVCIGSFSIVWEYVLEMYHEVLPYENN